MSPEQIYTNLVNDAKNGVKGTVPTSSFISGLALLAQVNGVEIKNETVEDLKIFTIKRDNITIRLDCEQLVSESKMVITHSITE